MKKFIFLGAPGVGKGTFAKILSKQYNLQHISPGEILRGEVERSTSIGLEVQDYVKAGKLVPDEVVNHMVVNTLQKSRGSGFILDGYPRTASQARFLHDHYTVPQKTSVTAINITLDRQVTIQKLLGRRQCRTCGGAYNTAHIVDGGYDMPAILPDTNHCRAKSHHCQSSSCPCILEKRDDDTADVITYRLNSYDRSIQEILDFYRQRGALRGFDVKKGIKDTSALWKVMASPETNSTSTASSTAHTRSHAVPAFLPRLQIA